jgi:hypothetical protein
MGMAACWMLERQAGAADDMVGAGGNESGERMKLVR